MAATLCACTRLYYFLSSCFASKASARFLRPRCRFFWEVHACSSVLHLFGCHSTPACHPLDSICRKLLFLRPHAANEAHCTGQAAIRQQVEERLAKVKAEQAERAQKTAKR